VRELPAVLNFISTDCLFYFFASLLSKNFASPTLQRRESAFVKRFGIEPNFQPLTAAPFNRF